MAARTKRAAKSTRGSGAKKVQAKKSTSKAATAKKTPAKKSTRKAATKKAPAKKAPAKKAPATKSTRKAATKKAPAKRAPAKKAPASKAPVKRTAPPPHRSRNFATQATVKKAPPKRKGPLDKFLLGQLAALQEERAIYTRQAESLRAEADLLAAEREPGDVQFDEESGEGDTLAVERERDLTLSAQAMAAVEEIDRALAKLDEGTYGVCEVCNSTIPKERLRALPYAALCVQCKSAGFSRR